MLRIGETPVQFRSYQTCQHGGLVYHASQRDGKLELQCAALGPKMDFLVFETGIDCKAREDRRIACCPAGRNVLVMAGNGKEVFAALVAAQGKWPDSVELLSNELKVQGNISWDSNPFLLPLSERAFRLVFFDQKEVWSVVRANGALKLTRCDFVGPDIGFSSLPIPLSNGRGIFVGSCPPSNGVYLMTQNGKSVACSEVFTLLGEKRSNASSVLVKNRFLVTFGGYNGRYLDDLSVLDTRSGKASSVRKQGQWHSVDDWVPFMESDGVLYLLGGVWSRGIYSISLGSLADLIVDDDVRGEFSAVVAGAPRNAERAQAPGDATSARGGARTVAQARGEPVKPGPAVQQLEEHRAVIDRCINEFEKLSGSFVEMSEGYGKRLDSLKLLAVSSQETQGFTSRDAQKYLLTKYNKLLSGLEVQTGQFVRDLAGYKAHFADLAGCLKDASGLAGLKAAIEAAEGDLERYRAGSEKLRERLEESGDVSGSSDNETSVIRGEPLEDEKSVSPPPGSVTINFLPCGLPSLSFPLRWKIDATRGKTAPLSIGGGKVAVSGSGRSSREFPKDDNIADTESLAPRLFSYQACILATRAYDTAISQVSLAICPGQLFSPDCGLPALAKVGSLRPAEKLLDSLFFRKVVGSENKTADLASCGAKQNQPDRSPVMQVIDQGDSLGREIRHQSLARLRRVVQVAANAQNIGSLKELESIISALKKLFEGEKAKYGVVDEYWGTSRKPSKPKGSSSREKQQSPQHCSDATEQRPS